MEEPEQCHAYHKVVKSCSCTWLKKTAYYNLRVNSQTVVDKPEIMQSVDGLLTLSRTVIELQSRAGDPNCSYQKYEE